MNITAERFSERIAMAQADRSRRKKLFALLAMGITAWACSSEMLDKAAEQHQRFNSACATAMPVLKAVAAQAPVCAECERLPHVVELVGMICSELGPK